MKLRFRLDNGYLTIAAAKGLDKDEQEKDTGKYIRKRTLCRCLHSVASMWVRSMIRGRYQGRVQTWYFETVCSEERSKTGSGRKQIYRH